MNILLSMARGLVYKSLCYSVVNYQHSQFPGFKEDSSVFSPAKGVMSFAPRRQAFLKDNLCSSLFAVRRVAVMKTRSTNELI